MSNDMKITNAPGLRRNSRHYQTLYLVLMVLLGILYAAQYALVMPPWGLLDETQHYHYIQVIAEEHRLPVMWQDKFSKAVVDSVFEVKRYVTLGAPKIPHPKTRWHLSKSDIWGISPKIASLTWPG